MNKIKQLAHFLIFESEEFKKIKATRWRRSTCRKAADSSQVKKAQLTINIKSLTAAKEKITTYREAIDIARWRGPNLL